MFRIMCILMTIILLFCGYSFGSDEKIKKAEKLKNKLTFALRSDIWMVNPDGSDQQQLTREGGASEPSWSPDGKSIVFVCDKKIWKYDFADGKSSKISNMVGYCISPSFSSDGKKIVFTHETNTWDPFVGGNYTEICIMNPDGSEPKVLVKANEAWKNYPQFSPWGEQIVFNELRSNNMSYYLLTYNLSNNYSDYLSSEPGWLEPAYSPNGNLVAAGWYSYDKGGSLRLINLKTLAQSDLLSNYPECQFCSPSFSPDGSKIVFEKQFYGQSKKMFIPYGIYMINLNGSDFSLLILDASDPDWL
jgi:Tol biopolymer transport system component